MGCACVSVCEGVGVIIIFPQDLSSGISQHEVLVLEEPHTDLMRYLQASGLESVISGIEGPLIFLLGRLGI